MVDDPFWGNLFHRRRRGEDQLYDILSEIPIFRDLSRRDFARLEGSFTAGVTLPARRS